MEKSLHQESPFTMKISFNALLKQYERQVVEAESEHERQHAKKVLATAEQHPELREGITDLSRISELEPEIDLILRDSFSPVLTHNEIKTAGIPFEEIIFKSSSRFNRIMQEAGPDFELKIRNLPEGHIYIMACSVILQAAYGVDVQFKRPLYYDIPDKRGIMKHYRITYNADFTEITPTDKARALTKDDIDQLIDGFENLELWKEKIPPGSWEFKGFVLSNIFDVTLDNSISDLKTWLLNIKTDHSIGLREFQNIFESLYGIKNLQVGFLSYDEDLETFDKISRDVPCYMLEQKKDGDCKRTMCKKFKEAILKDYRYFAISDIERFSVLSGNQEPYASYLKQGFNSAILAPIANEGRLLGILELLSPEKKELNSVNANKLVDVMPFIVSALNRNRVEERNRIEAVIQNECTSLHESVKWKFAQEAKRFLREKEAGNSVSFREISFKKVYPLYGQIDIKNSSIARNQAAKKDIGNQLRDLQALFNEAFTFQGLPIFEEYILQLEQHLDGIDNHFKTNSEQIIVEFLQEEIHPALEAIAQLNPSLAKKIAVYQGHLNNQLGLYYSARERYDNTVKTINKKMADTLDEKHKEAYAMFPHYFERYKTDGVEHNIYIGQSISNKRKFNEVYLQNLKLWQLQTMCYMENVYYNLKPELDIPLDVTSLILVHSTPLAIRFRMDEKHFDVDGTYNARYEILKKRIDKAHIKGTKKRITQPGRITVVYSQKQDEKEYLRYIRLLQSKDVLSDDIRIDELEELQGVSGLKAISVGILYKKEAGAGLLSYDDLLKDLSK